MIRKNHYHEYKDKRLKGNVIRFESRLADITDPKKLEAMRAHLVGQDDTLVARQAQGRKAASRARTREKRHQVLDKIHAINRRLNELEKQ